MFAFEVGPVERYHLPRITQERVPDLHSSHPARHRPAKPFFGKISRQPGYDSLRCVEAHRSGEMYPEGGRSPGGVSEISMVSPDLPNSDEFREFRGHHTYFSPWW